MVTRLNDPTAENVLDSLDATLASLSARSPFSKWARGTLHEVHSRLDQEAEKPLASTAENTLT